MTVLRMGCVCSIHGEQTQLCLHREDASVEFQNDSVSMVTYARRKTTAFDAKKMSLSQLRTRFGEGRGDGGGARAYGEPSMS